MAARSLKSYFHTFASSFLSSFSCTAVRFGEPKATEFTRLLYQCYMSKQFQTLIAKALVKQTRRKWTKVKASLRNLNLFTNFGSVAKRIASRLLNSHKSLRAVTTLGIYAMNCIVANLCTILISISIKSPRQSSQVHASSLKQLAKQVRLARAYRV